MSLICEYVRIYSLHLTKESRGRYHNNKDTPGCDVSVIYSASREGCSITASIAGHGTIDVFVVGHLLPLRSGLLLATVKEMVAVGEQ